MWIQTENLSLVIDTGPDFRYQMLRAKVDHLDAVLFTHGHKDHTAGLDDVRAYNYFQQKAMDVYATEATLDVLRREFSYVFENRNYPGIPQLALHSINPDQSFFIKNLEIIPICVMHHKMEVLGFRIGDFTYVTDANFIPPQELEKIKGTRILVLNALRHQHHISHFTLAEAIELAQKIGAEKTYFTHISHQLGMYEKVNASLPNGIALAWDGMEIKMNVEANHSVN